ncbi:MAG TPA: hypothetical protein VMF30_15355 [Pirellulales bacterium]|nr:hypothetical protein [Pirellulales bacterium]
MLRWKLPPSLYFGLAFLVIAAPVASRCAALRMPTVRLVKARRLCSAEAADSFKARLGACQQGTERGAVAERFAKPSNQPKSWWRALAVVFALYMPPSGAVAARGFARRCRAFLSQQFSAAGNPLRC